MYLLIQSKGEAEIGALTLLGASTKRGNDEKIGMFGSGFKYALAYLLREHIPFRVFFGEAEVMIGTEPVDFRGKTFQRMTVNGVPTSITTDSGPDWKLQDAIREIYSNALDEGLVHFDTAEHVVDNKGLTSIYIELTPAVEFFLSERHRYFLEGAPICTNDLGSIHHAQEEARYYRRGIWVNDRETNGLFSYNLNNVVIAEHRKADLYSIRDQVGYLLCHANEPIWRILLRSDGKKFEWQALSWSFPINSPFADWLKQTYQFTYTDRDLTLMKPAHESLGLLTHEEGQSVLGRVLPTYLEWRKNLPMELLPMTEHVSELIRTAKAQLSSLGLALDFPIRYVASNDKALAFVKDRVCYITPSALRAGQREFTKTLLEEAIHINTQEADYSRGFQEALLEITMKALERYK